MTIARIAQFEVGEGRPLLLIVGPDVVEDEPITLRTAQTVQALAEKHRLPLVFKCSVDKANRTSLNSYRGLGIGRGLEILARVKKQTGLPMLIDAHETGQVPEIAQVADVVQVPAFLCRQTDLLVACAKSGRAVNIKKGQFLAPGDMRHPLAKIHQSGNPNVLLTERGSSFGYHNLVVDMRSLSLMRSLGAPVCFDATHSVQLPSAGDGVSSGERQFVRPLARAAVAAGIDALFLEVHENPAQAKCDGPNSLDFQELDRLLGEVTALRRALGQP